MTWRSLFVTPNTLKTHLRMIYRKLGAESREEAVTRAREGGLIWPSAPPADDPAPVR